MMRQLLFNGVQFKCPRIASRREFFNSAKHVDYIIIVQVFRLAENIQDFDFQLVQLN